MAYNRSILHARDELDVSPRAYVFASGFYELIGATPAVTTRMCLQSSVLVQRGADDHGDE